MMDEYTKEEWRKEMMEEHRRDEIYERLMRSDEEFFFEHSKYAGPLMEMLANFKKECEMYDLEYEDEVKNLM